MGLPLADTLRLNLLSSLYGYLSGADICMWLDPQLIIGAQSRLPTVVGRAVAQAVSEVQSHLLNQYDLAPEFTKTDVVPPIAACVIAGGAVTGISASLTGSGFKTAPTISLVRATGDTTGINAAATVQVSPSVISLIHLTSRGRGYRAAPVISFLNDPTDTTGAGAEAICTVNKGGCISTLTLINGGGGYTAAPTVVFNGGQGTGAIALASVKYGSVSGFTITTPGTLYTLPPVVQFNLANSQVADQRVAKLVKIISIYAVRNIMGQATALSEKTVADIQEAYTMLTDIKAGFDSLPIISANMQIRSAIDLTADNFHNLG